MDRLQALCDHLKDEKLFRGSSVVPVEEWIRSPYFVGDELAYNMYPYWRQAICEIFNNREQTEVLFGHATGCGKTTGAMVAWLRFLYELSCMESPQETFGLFRTSKIYLAYLGTTIKQAELTGFGDFRNLVDSIPYFQRDFPRDPDSKEVLKFPHNINVISGSGAEHTIGTNLISVVLDEANFRKGSGTEGDLEHVMGLYANSRSRIRSRFLKKNVKFPGLSILVSSPTTQSSFTQKIIEEASTDTRYYTGALWGVAPLGTYSSTGFWVYKGSERITPFVVKCPGDLDILGLGVDLSSGDTDRIIRSLPSQSKGHFLWVPDEFRRDFERSPLRCLADLGGVAVGSYGKLVTSRVQYDACVDHSLSHPFIQQEVTLSLTDKVQLMDYFRKESFFRNNAPARHPHEKRYFHVDQSTSNDSTGIAACHLAGYIETASGRMPLVELDFAIRVNPPAPPDKISIEKCRKFLFDLRDCGMDIGGLTMDTWGSVDFLQITNTAGIPSRAMSLDQDDGGYLKFVEHLYSVAFRMYDYPPFKREIFSLNHDRVKGKVDHPKKNDDGTVGGKDVSDAIIGAFLGVLRSSPFDDAEIVRQKRVIDIVRSVVVSDSDYFDPAQSLFPDFKGEWVGGALRHIGEGRG